MWADWREIIASLDVLVYCCSTILLLIQRTMLLVFIVARVHCWIPVSLLPTRLSCAFRQCCSPGRQSSACIIAESPSQVQYFAFVLEFHEVPAGLLIGSFWVAALPSAPLGAVPSANLMRVLCVSLSRSLRKILKRVSPRTDSWGTLFITGLQVVFWTWEYCVEGFQEQKVTGILQRLMKRV